MKTYFSTFITGFGEVVKQALRSTIKDVNIKMMEDGLIIYETDITDEEIKNLRFLNNSFILLKISERTDPNSPNAFIKSIINDPDIEDIKSLLPDKKTSFRIVFSRENQLIKIHSDILKKFEDKITKLGLEVNRADAKLEFWVILRRNGLGLFGLRVTQHKDLQKVLEKGELRPELAHILCLISYPSDTDIFLDPFAGYGAIPIERAVSFLYAKIIAGDINLGLVEKLRTKVASLNKKIVVGHFDGTNIRVLNDKSISKIVTDPPWGIYQGRNLNLESLYSNMLKEFSRILKPFGIAVILVGDNEILEDILKKYSDKFDLLKKHHTLVNGQKAQVFKILLRP